jgi:hypothetical protein
MEYMCDLSDEQKISKVASAGVLASFVEAFDGQWNHEAWLELVSYVEGMGCALPHEKLGLALEAERELYHRGLAKNEQLAEKAPVIEETIAFIEGNTSFLESLEGIKGLAIVEMSHEHKKKLLNVLSEKFTKEVKDRMEKGHWMPKKIVEDVENLTKKLL